MVTKVSFGGGSGSGAGALKLASKADGTPAIFADKSALDTYTNIHTAWANSLAPAQSVALGVDDERVDYAYVRRDGDWVDVVTNFKGEKGEKGDSVKIILVVNKREGQNLTTTVELDDGTSAESTPIDIAFIKSVAGQSPNESGEVQITPLNIGAYTTAETDAQINTATQQLESEIQAVETQANDNSQAIVEAAPYRTFTKFADVAVDLVDLDGVNDEQIRANNFVTFCAAMGEMSQAAFSISDDTRISPVNFVELYIRAYTGTRCSAFAITKQSSEMHVISASTNDVGVDTVARWRKLSDTESLKNAEINTINANGEFVVNVNGNKSFSAAPGVLKLHNHKIQNLAAGTASTDAVQKQQMDVKIDEEFISAVLASVDKENYAIDLRDAEKTSGYGKNGVISYFAAGPGNIEPNLDYGKWFFVHEKTDGVVGYHMLHKSLFPDEIQSKQSAFFTLAGTAKAALGKANQDASTTINGAIWNSNGRLIPPTEDANNQTPAEFYNKDGEIVTEFSESLAGCYSYGAMSIIGPQLIYKGRLSSDGDDSTTIFTPDANSDWFVFYGKAGGGTFNVKKIFMIFPRLYDDLSYITQTAAEGLGIKVSSNSEAIRELQENSQSDEESILEGIASGFIYANNVEVG